MYLRLIKNTKLYFVLFSLLFVSFITQSEAKEGFSYHVSQSNKLPMGKTVISIPVRIQNVQYANHRLGVARHIIKNRLMKVLRRDMGATYSVNVRIKKSVFEKRLVISFSSDTERSQELIEATFQTLQNLVEKGVSKKEVETIKTIQTQRQEKNKTSNQYWIKNLSLREKHGFSLEGIVIVDKVIKNLRLNEVEDVVRQIFLKRNISIATGIR